MAATTTLAQGSSVTLTVGETDTLLIDGGRSASAIVEAVTGVPGSANRQRLVNHPGGQALYGPFGAGTVQLSAVGGSIQYAQGAAPLDDEPQNVKYNQNTQSLVSGDGTIISMAPTLMTLAAMLAYAPTTDGVEVYVTDLPAGTRGRFYWHLASSKWRPAGMVLVDRSLTLDSGVNSTAEQYIKNLSIPAGLLFTGAEILFEYSLGRSNTTDAGAASNLRIGNAGTISDTAFGNGSGFISATGTVRAFGNAHRYRVVSGTEIEKAGNGSTSGASFSASGSSLALAPWNVGSTTSQLYFATTVQLAAATGTTLPQVGYSALWLLPS